MELKLSSNKIKEMAKKKAPFQKFRAKSPSYFAICNDCDWRSEKSKFKTTVEADAKEHQQETSADGQPEHKTNVVEEG